MKKFLLILILLISFCSFSQNDSIKLKNNNILVGEIKSLINGIMTMKTSYSDKDFKIEYKEVAEIYLDQIFLINLVNGSHYLGRVKSVRSGIIEIISVDLTFETEIEKIIQLNASGNRF